MNAEEQLAHQSSCAHRARQSCDDPQSSQPSRLFQNELIHRSTLRTKSHADTDLSCALTDGVRDDSIKADDTQQQSQRGKASYQISRGAMNVCGWRIVAHIVHTRFANGRDIRMNLMNSGNQ